MNTLYYGDNLKILRDYIKDESIDLIYLDPPFNSNRNYNVLFRDESGVEAASQITAFEDTWHWHTGETATTYHELLLAGDEVSKMIEAFHSFIGNNQMMAYLVMMAIRLKELHRVLKPTGSLYLHCDPTASHYLKILLDVIFGAQHFQNEIIWRRTNAHNYRTKGYVRANDVILYYTRSEDYTFNPIYTEYSAAQLKRYKPDENGRLFTGQDLTYTGTNPERQFEWRGAKPPANRVWGSSKEQLEEMWHEGRILKTRDGRPRLDGYKMYLDDAKGRPVTTCWTDVDRIPNTSAERLGYDTQKPVALLERILSASSNKGDIVLDPFCGCGTTIAAAQKLDRNWIGIDITHLSIALQKYRLKDQFNLEPVTESRAREIEDKGFTEALATAYQIVGEPEDLSGAEQLASEDRYQFQWWALSLIKARPLGAAGDSKVGKKGSDKGIDGTITFIDDNTGKAKRVIISVKSGKPNVTHIRDLGHVIDRDSAAIGVYLTLEPPTKPMLTEAAEKGFYHSPGWGRDYPRLQIITVEELLNGRQLEMPPTQMTFKQAEKIVDIADGQGALFNNP